MARKRKKWMPADDEYLKAHLSEPVSSVAQKLGCTQAGIYQRMHRMGLRRNDWIVESNGWLKPLMTLCEICKRADASMRCPWVDKFEPVPGWTAKPTAKNGKTGKFEYTSYKVISCPLHIPDEPRERKEA